MKLLPCLMLHLFALFIVHGRPMFKEHQKDNPYDNCVCKTFSCACCGTLEIPQIGINDTACLSFGYLPKEYGISLIVEIDDSVLINETISARNPPPICLPIPYIEDFVDVCVHFTDLAINNTVFSGCVALEARMWWVYVVAEYKLGCFATSNFNGAVETNYSTNNTTKLINLNTMKKNINSIGDVLVVAKNVYKASRRFKNRSASSVKTLETNEI